MNERKSRPDPPGSVRDGRFYWLADESTDPGEWPLIARKQPDDEWLRYDMSTAEFVYRAIADPESKPITVADPAWPPAFSPAVGEA